MFDLPQVKWYLIFTTRKIVYELIYELLNDLRLRNLGKYDIDTK